MFHFTDDGQKTEKMSPEQFNEDAARTNPVLNLYGEEMAMTAVDN